jgi:hypothetical protein
MVTKITTRFDTKCLNYAHTDGFVFRTARTTNSHLCSARRAQQTAICVPHGAHNKQLYAAWSERQQTVFSVRQSINPSIMCIKFIRQWATSLSTWFTYGVLHIALNECVQYTIQAVFKTYSAKYIHIYTYIYTYIYVYCIYIRVYQLLSSPGKSRRKYSLGISRRKVHLHVKRPYCL